MAGRSILFAATNYFRSPFQVGSHHLAREFARAGWRVAFVSNPISPLHALKGRDPLIRARWDCYRRGGEVDPATGIWTYVPGALLTPHPSRYLRAEALARHWWRWTLPRVVGKVRRAGFGRPDVIYFDTPLQRFWLDALPPCRSVLRIADRNHGFADWTPAATTLQGELAREVDLVVYTARSLEADVRALGPKRVEFLPNGVHFRHFAEGDRTPPPEYQGLPRPIAVYVGAMEAWFAFDLVAAAAERLPGVSFVLIGPDHLARQRLAPRPNLHVLGPRPFAALPAYLHNADVGLIPFDVAGHPDLVHGINPLKLYEYLACGLPVVATAWEELRHLGSPALLTEGREEFIAALAEAVRRRPERAELVRFAAARDWSAVREELEGMLVGGEAS